MQRLDLVAAKRGRREGRLKYWFRFKRLRARDLGLGALMALVAAVVLDRTGPAAGFNVFCVSVLFGLAIAVGVFGLAAFWREGTRG